MAGNTQAIFLTEEDQALLRQVIAGQKLKPLNTLRPPPPPIPRGTRAMFIALPETEISALTEFGGTGTEATGTGTGSGETGDADIPGSGLCELFRLVDDGLYSLSGRTEMVYNSSRTAIGRDWIQVHQDNFGLWWAITGGGSSSGTSEVLFEITSVCCEETGTGTGYPGTGTGGPTTGTDDDCLSPQGTAIGTPLEVECGGTLPTGSQILYDRLGCFLTGNSQLLIGMLCYAARMDIGGGECVYQIKAMCCPESEC